MSLRFLSVFVLGKNVQEGVHDSIEDALAALQLFYVYNVLKKAGRVEKTIQTMYKVGRKCGWDPSLVL